MIALAIEADDKHRTPMAITDRLVECDYRNVAAHRRRVAKAFTKAAAAKFIGAAKVFDGVVGIIGSQHGLHGAKVLVAKGQNVRPHAK
jgi:hypothetical protein